MEGVLAPPSSSAGGMGSFTRGSVSSVLIFNPRPPGHQHPFYDSCCSEPSSPGHLTLRRVCPTGHGTVVESRFGVTQYVLGNRDNVPFPSADREVRGRRVRGPGGRADPC